jgi:hypothetical protein
MKRLLLSLFAATLLSTAAYAHGGHDHIRGTVTQINGQSIVVQTSGKATKTITVVTTTMFMKGEKHASLGDLKVGDRVVIEVPEGKLTADEVQIGAAATKAAEAHEHK